MPRETETPSLRNIYPRWSVRQTTQKVKKQPTWTPCCKIHNFARAFSDQLWVSGVHAKSSLVTLNMPRNKIVCTACANQTRVIVWLLGSVSYMLYLSSSVNTSASNKVQETKTLLNIYEIFKKKYSLVIRRWVSDKQYKKSVNSQKNTLPVVSPTLPLFSDSVWLASVHPKTSLVTVWETESGATKLCVGAINLSVGCNLKCVGVSHSSCKF